MPNLINSPKLAKVQTFKVSFKGQILLQVCYDWTDFNKYMEITKTKMKTLLAFVNLTEKKYKKTKWWTYMFILTFINQVYNYYYLKLARISS